MKTGPSRYSCSSLLQPHGGELHEDASGLLSKSFSSCDTPDSNHSEGEEDEDGDEGESEDRSVGAVEVLDLLSVPVHAIQFPCFLHVLCSSFPPRVACFPVCASVMGTR